MCTNQNFSPKNIYIYVLCCSYLLTAGLGSRLIFQRPGSWLFFLRGPGSDYGSWFFPKWLWPRLQGAKKNGSGSWLFYPKKSNKSTISLCFLSSSRAEEPAYFEAAPVPDFFPSGSGSKEPKTPGSDSGSPALINWIYKYGDRYVYL